MLKFGSIVILLYCFGMSASEVPLCIDNCPVDEVYSKCNAGLCESNCWDRAGSNDCDCTAGCICRPGLIRDPISFRCISTQKCSVRKPGQCPTNEYWSSNLAGCQKSCDTIDVLFKCRPSPGCVCLNGFIRSSINGQCIPINSCKVCPLGYSMSPKTGRCSFCCQECPENEEFKDCGPYCQPDCNSEAAAKPMFCIDLCKTGCFCKKNFVRDPSTGKCIPKEWCQVCPENETYSCGNPSCEKNCSNLKEICQIVNIRCEDKCYCNEGFVRNVKGGPCVPVETCNRRG